MSLDFLNQALRNEVIEVSNFTEAVSNGVLLPPTALTQVVCVCSTSLGSKTTPQTRLSFPLHENAIVNSATSAGSHYWSRTHESVE